MKNIKIQVSPVTEGWSSLNNSMTKVFTDKKSALSFAKNMLSEGWKEVNYNTDYYTNGECIKNEFAKYDGTSIKVYSTTDYKPKKVKKLVYNKEANIKMFFNL